MMDVVGFGFVREYGEFDKLGFLGWNGCVFLGFGVYVINL